MKYRKKPVVIEAMELKEGMQSLVEVCEWCDGKMINHQIVIETLEGDITASVGDYVIKGVNGEFYPCKPDIFQKTYEAI